MDALVQDVRYALRQLVRAPAFTLTAVLTLALGLGATTAIFGTIDAVLLEPLPYRDVDRIITLWQTDLKQGGARDAVAPANFLDWRERSRSFEALAAVEPYSHDSIGPDGPEQFRTWLVTEQFFDVLGVAPLIGRTPRSDDHDRGAAPVVVLSHRLWQSRFGGDAEIVGRTLSLDDQPTTVIGVMPPEFTFPPGRDLWVPRALQGWEAQNRTSTFWEVVGKLRPGVSLAAAQAELDGIGTQLAAEYPGANAESGIAAVPLTEHLVGNVRPALLLFLGAVGFVLLIACVNVASLLLARAARRKREFAIRGVLGAAGARLIRQLATESVVLGALGAAAGLALAAAGLNAFAAMMPDSLPRDASPGVDTRTVLFAAALALGTAVLFGLAPALQAARTDLRERLHLAAQSSRAARRFRGALVVGELALATVLLIGTGLLARSFTALLDVDRGYRADNVLAVTVQAWSHYPDGAQRAAFVDQTLDRIAGLPGVIAAGAASSLPLAEDIGADVATFEIAGRPSESDEALAARVTIVAGDVFQALGVPLRAGRMLAPSDDVDAPPVLLVNEAMARRHWPGEVPIGATVTVGFGGVVTAAEVVGVVADFREARLQDEPQPALFLPHAQRPTGAMHFTVRSATDALGLARAVQNEIWVMNPTMPTAGTTTLEILLEDAVRARRLTMFLVLAFSLTALALAAVGTYGVLTYESGRRAQEIGVRMALGAQRHWVVRLVVGEGLKLSLLGIGIGVAIALAVTRFLASFLFGVQPFDPPTFVGVAMLLIAVTALASYLPARRAASVDPMRALREE